MDQKEILQGFQACLPKFELCADDAETFSEAFAIARYKKKFEVPDSTHTRERKEKCWSDWLAYDSGVPTRYNTRLPRELYIARSHLHDDLKNFRMGDIDLPTGSLFDPTRGHNSVEARLQESEWTCTHECFEAFSRVVYNHKGLRRAARMRYNRWRYRNGFSFERRTDDRQLYNYFKSRVNPREVGFHIFQWKLERVVTFVYGSRFATVPKNNEKDRPINIEPFGNIVVQRCVGNGLRNTVRNILEMELDKVPDLHKLRISDQTVATIDLQNASDSVSLALVEFLFPTWFVKQLKQCRSPFILGPDKEYYQLNKISSMGNGFTFELMTLILTRICRTLDPEATVYGDDIVIKADQAERLIEVLERIGFVVNRDKSFISGPFRESCGSNFHVSEGYIESYDFRYPVSVNDCVVFFNKVTRLSLIYKSFKKLRHHILRSCPFLASQLGHDPYALTCNIFALQGHRKESDNEPLPFSLPPFFMAISHAEFQRACRKSGRQRVPKKYRAALSRIQVDWSQYYVTPAYKFVPEERTKAYRHLKPWQWSKYLMYLAAARVAKDVVTGKGTWVEITYICSGERPYRLKSLADGAT